MPGRQSPLTKREVLRGLKLLGFRHRDTRGSHMSYVHENGRGRFRKVTVDIHNEPYARALLKSMAKQAGLSAPEFHAACRDSVLPQRWP